MKSVASLLFLLTWCLVSNAQIPSTKERIQSFIDSIGRSNDRYLTSSAMYPAVANGANFEWKTNIWRNNKKQLLWVENIIPDSIRTVFFYCKKTLVFVGELTYDRSNAADKPKPLFRNIFFSNSKIIDDSAPERNRQTVDFYLEEGKHYLRLAEKIK